MCCYESFRKTSCEIRSSKLSRFNSSNNLVICLERGADCLHVAPDATAVHKPHHRLPHLNPDWFLPFWYQLTQVVLENRPLKRRSVVVIPAIVAATAVARPVVSCLSVYTRRSSARDRSGRANRSRRRPPRVNAPESGNSATRLEEYSPEGKSEPDA